MTLWEAGCPHPALCAKSAVRTRRLQLVAYLESIYKVSYLDIPPLILRYPSGAGPKGLRMSGRPKSAHMEVSKCERIRKGQESAGDSSLKSTLYKDSIYCGH